MEERMEVRFEQNVEVENDHYKITARVEQLCEKTSGTDGEPVSYEPIEEDEVEILSVKKWDGLNEQWVDCDEMDMEMSAREELQEAARDKADANDDGYTEVEETFDEEDEDLFDGDEEETYDDGDDDDLYSDDEDE
jgi:hypothetical protein